MQHQTDNARPMCSYSCGFYFFCVLFEMLRFFFRIYQAVHTEDVAVAGYVTVLFFLFYFTFEVFPSMALNVRHTSIMRYTDG